MAGTRRSFDFIMDPSLGTEPEAVEAAAAKLRGKVEALADEKDEEEEGDEEEEEEEAVGVGGGRMGSRSAGQQLQQGKQGTKETRGKRDEAVEEAVFMSSYIPRSLHELPVNSFDEARRIAAGEREQVYASAVRGMLVVPEEEEGPGEPAEEGEEDGEEESGEGETSSDEEDGDSDENDEEEDDGEWREKRGSKAGRGLTEEEQAAHKAQRKAEKKTVKEAKQEKRKSKIPKHVKKAKIKATTRSRRR